MKELRNICTINDIKVGDVIVWNDGTDNEVISVERQYVRVTDKGVAYTFHVNSLTSLKVYTPESVVVSSVSRRLPKRAQRKPKYNEIWTRNGVKYKFVGPIDSSGKAAWLSMDDDLNLFRMSEMTPPNVKPDDSVLASMWVNVYPNVTTMAASYADSIAHHDRIGRVNLLGEWVECDGQEVLG